MTGVEQAAAAAGNAATPAIPIASGSRTARAEGARFCIATGVGARHRAALGSNGAALDKDGAALDKEGVTGADKGAFPAIEASY